MSFNPNVPNASQSPGIFPIQNNTNYARLKTIINADHVFNDSAQSTDGIHRQCTMVARAEPVALPGGSNSILYSWVDGNGQTQLRFYNGNTDVHITPTVDEAPIRVVGEQLINAGQAVVIYADPGFAYCGTAFGMIKDTNSYIYYSVLMSEQVVPQNNLTFINDFGNTTINQPNSRPVLLFNASNNLQIRNLASVNLTLVWSLIINRIS